MSETATGLMESAEHRAKWYVKSENIEGTAPVTASYCKGSNQIKALFDGGFHLPGANNSILTIVDEAAGWDITRDNGSRTDDRI